MTKTLYNAKGSPAAKSAEDTTNNGFKRGGKAKKRASGGSVQARAHGGSVRGMKSSGGSPYSSGHALSKASAGKGAGHEGESVSSD